MNKNHKNTTQTILVVKIALFLFFSSNNKFCYSFNNILNRKRNNKILSTKSGVNSIHNIWKNTDNTNENQNQETAPIVVETEKDDVPEEEIPIVVEIAKETNEREEAKEEIILQEEHQKEKRKQEQMGMKVALFCTCLTILGSKCSLPATLGILASPESGLLLSSSTATTAMQYSKAMAKVLTLSTSSIAIGKFFLGPVIDLYGGILSLKVALSSLCILMLLIATTKHFLVFSICWILVDFIFSTSWPGCLNAIHEYFPREEWTEIIALMGSASRVGNTLAFATFGFILPWCQRVFPNKKEYWRSVFWVSSLVQLVPLTLLTLLSRRRGVESAQKENLMKNSNRLISFNGSNHSPSTKGSNSNNPSTKTKTPSSLQVLKQQAKTLPFWLHLFSRSSLMIYGSFLLFVPSLMMSNCYNLSSSLSSKTASLFSFGCLSSLTILSKFYANATSIQRFRTIISLLSLSTLCAISHLLHVMQYITLSPKIAIMSMFVWGFSFALPYYIPPSMYALEMGGNVSSATIMDIFDFVAFGLLAFFNGYVASIPMNSLKAWVVPFGILTSCSIVSLFSLGFVLRRDLAV